MNVQLPHGASGFYPAPANHIEGDPTPWDQAVYIPSVTPGFAIQVYAEDWPRDLPAGVEPRDLNFLDPDNCLFRISHVMSSAGQAMLQKKPCIIQTRDRKSTVLICDSGGYQIATKQLTIDGDHDRLEILRWLERNADWAMTLDVPTGRLGDPEYPYKTFADCLNETVYNLEFFQKHRVLGATKFLNVLQGNDRKQADYWYNAVKGFEFEGWAFAGKLRHNFFYLCRRIIKMASENLIQDRNWIHILGTCQPETAVGLTALQRSINRHINPHLRISYDTSTPFRMLRGRSVFTLPRFDRDGMTIRTEKCPDGKPYINSPVKFPWPSPLGDKMTLGDLNVKPGHNLNSYRDNQANHYLAHHNLASLCYGIALANRVFDSESIEGKHTVAETMGEAIAAIDHVLNSRSLQELERKRSVFNRVRKIELTSDNEQDRFFQE